MYVLWDIDGTLLSTDAGLRAWTSAASTVLKRPDAVEVMRTSGRSDGEIAARMCAVARAQGDQVPKRLLRAYEGALAHELSANGARALPNARANLETLAARGDAINMLLTGNLPGAARRKLEAVDLWHFFGAGGAFGAEGIDRTDIARAARRLAARHAGHDPTAEQLVVIGDTPHDIACGKAIGARTVAVATGRAYTLEDLEAADPERAFPALPEPRVLCEALGLP